ncbi:MAG: hypothetical protein AB1746_02300 [Candidatus Zixiibacteriota bacterium]
MRRSVPMDHLLCSFVCAGSSAALFAVAHLYQDLWFISLFAFIPFLWRNSRVSITGSVIVSIILASTYFLTIVPICRGIYTDRIILQFVCLNVIFTIYGVVINRTVRLTRFNAPLIALSWFPCEYILTRYIGMGEILNFADNDSYILIKISSLFGMLLISVLVILVNSLIMLIIGRLVFSIIKMPMTKYCNRKTVRNIYSVPCIKRPRFIIPILRAPPKIHIGMHC